jgi:hypothetical protein
MVEAQRSKGRREDQGFEIGNEAAGLISGGDSMNNAYCVFLASLYQAKPPLNKILADQNPSSDPRSQARIDRSLNI